MLRVVREGSRVLALAVMLPVFGCEAINEVPDDPGASEEQSGIPRSSKWGEFRLIRHQRSGLEVLARARLIATVVLQDDQLPAATLMPQSILDDWQARAEAEPFREGAFRFELDGRDVLARYRPATDRVTVSAMDTRVRPDHPTGYPDPGIGEPAALTVALDCMTQLEQLGVLGREEFSTTPTVTSNNPVYFEDEAWIERYSFMFNPTLDGLPLRSAEVVISVNAWTGTCQRITVGGQVRVERIGDAEVKLLDQEIAARIVEEKVLAASLPGVQDVRITGSVGYYLPVEQTVAIVPPRFLASFATASGSLEEPTMSRRFYVGLSLDDPDHEPLVDLLHPL